MAEFLAGQTHRRRINQRLHLIDMVAQHTKEQGLIAVVQCVERNEFFQRIGYLAQVVQNPHDLFVLGVHMGRQQAAQIKGIAFRIRKSGPLVQKRIVQQRQTGGHITHHRSVKLRIHGDLGSIDSGFARRSALHHRGCGTPVLCRKV